MAPTKIAVHARLRPAAERDGRVLEGDINLVRASEDAVQGAISVPNPQNLAERHLFRMDAVYGPETTQEELFNKSVKPLLNGVYKGINTTIFAYGVTGSGKTHTMQGGLTTKEQGIIPRVMKSIFRRRDAVKKLELALSYSYVQILNDEVYDLLPQRSDSAPAKQLKICSTGHGDEIVVVDMMRKEATSIEDFEADYHRASSSRKTAATMLNSTSSRSHAILTIYVQTKELDSDKVFESRICLVDLAGSEDNNLTGNDKARMRESKAINTSLTLLGKVVDALNTGAAVIPYRECKLTRMLSETLGGNSLSILLLNLAPGEKYSKHTLRTLQFSTRARQVESNPQSRERDCRIPPQQAQISSRAPSRMGPPLRTNAAAPASGQADAARKAAPARTGTIAGISGANKPPTIRTGSQISAQTFDPATQKYIDQTVKVAVEEAMRKKEAEVAEKAKPVARSISPPIEAPRKAAAGASSADPTAGLSEEEMLTRAKVLVEQAREMERQEKWDMAIQFLGQARIYAPDKRAKLEKRIAEVELVRAGQLPVEVIKAGHKSRSAKTAPEEVPTTGGALKRSKVPLQPLSALAASTNRMPAAVEEVSGKAAGKKPGDAKAVVGKELKEGTTGAQQIRTAVKTSLIDKENLGLPAVEKKRKAKSSRDAEEEYQPEEAVVVPKKVKRPERRAQPKIPVYVDVSD